MSIKLIATDLDGTFLTDQKEITAFTKEVVEKIGQMGIHFVPATGRAFDAVPENVLALPNTEYVITSNGAAIYSVSEKRRIYQCLLAPEAVDAILQMKIPKEIAMEAFVEGIPYSEERYISHPELFGATGYGTVYVKKTRRPVESIRDFMRIHREELESLAFVSADPKTRDAFRRKLLEEIPDIYVTSSVPHMLEAGHINAGKGKTLLHLLDTLGISREETMAFGDADNDIDMLTEVKYGIAMANGTENCQKAAFAITDNNNEDGVAKGVLKFINKG